MTASRMMANSQAGDNNMVLLQHIEVDMPRGSNQQHRPHDELFHVNDRKGKQPAGDSDSEPECDPETSRFWRKLSLTHVEPDDDQKKQVAKATTDVCMSLNGPNQTPPQDSDEFKKKDKEIRREPRRSSKCSGRFHALRKCKSPACPTNPTSPTSPPSPPQEEAEDVNARQLEQELEFRRRLSVKEGYEYLEDFLQHHFSEHRDAIVIVSNKTLEEIKMLGNEDVDPGVRGCRRLFNAPVISDEVGSLLWKELRQGMGLDHSHELDTDDEAEQESMSPDELRKRKASLIAEEKAEFMAMQQSYFPPDSIFESNVASSSTAMVQSPTAMVQSPTAMVQSPSGELPTPIAQSPTATATAAATATATATVTTTTTLVAAQQPTPSEKKVIDGFLGGVKRRTVKGAEILAASLASGYA